MNVLNLTPHNIKIFNNGVERIIQTSGIIRLEIETKQSLRKSKQYSLPIVKREVKKIIWPNNMTKRQFNSFLKKNNVKGIIVSAQMVEFLKKELPDIDILTVGETIREQLSDGSVVIKGVKNLVIN